jgi:phospholipase D1/2
MMPTATAARRSRNGRGPAWGKIITFLVVCIALAAAWRYTPLSELVTAQKIVEWARAIRQVPWAPVVVILAYVPTAFLMFPRPLLTLMTVVAFGPWWGFVYSMVGIVVSAIATYYAGKVLDKKTVKRLAGRYYDGASKALRRHGLMAMTAMRIVPAAPFAVEGILAGAMDVKLWHFTVGTMLGVLPGVLATSVFGQQITAALEDGGINWWIVGGVVLAFAALIWFFKRQLSDKA